MNKKKEKRGRVMKGKITKVVGEVKTKDAQQWQQEKGNKSGRKRKEDRERRERGRT